MTILIGKIINVVVSLLGLIAVVLIIIGGFQWMTSGGEEEKIMKAKQLMINGIIGLVIIVLAYAIATFIIGKLVDVVNQPATLPAAP
jgi:TRAP-type C4-dicarboxylate transport system permease small subunit